MAVAPPFRCIFSMICHQLNLPVFSLCCFLSCVLFLCLCVSLVSGVLCQENGVRLSSRNLPVAAPAHCSYLCSYLHLEVFPFLSSLTYSNPFVKACVKCHLQEVFSDSLSPDTISASPEIPQYFPSTSCGHSNCFPCVLILS